MTFILILQKNQELEQQIQKLQEQLQQQNRTIHLLQEQMVGLIHAFSEKDSQNRHEFELKSLFA